MKSINEEHKKQILLLQTGLINNILNGRYYLYLDACISLFILPVLYFSYKSKKKYIYIYIIIEIREFLKEVMFGHT